VPGDEGTSYLVRHAKAGSRERWTAPDRDRPLSAPGRIQAIALTALLGPTTRSIASSPYLRCMETVAPLAESLGLSVEQEDRLAEGADMAWAIGRLASVPGCVLCTHGDVMASIVMSLDADRVPLIGGMQWAKAATWAFDISGGRIVGGRYLPPPD
jgi:phosphohistidine phosphatase SixA